MYEGRFNSTTGKSNKALLNDLCVETRGELHKQRSHSTLSALTPRPSLKIVSWNRHLDDLQIKVQIQAPIEHRHMDTWKKENRGSADGEILLILDLVQYEFALPCQTK